MFTGLVQAVGRVVESEPLRAGRGSGRGEAGRRLVVDPRGWSCTPAEGDSIAVDGVCLTVAGGKPGRTMTFHVVPETLNRTTLGRLGPGSRVNLEHAATLATFMGGHLVQGHVDGVGVVKKVEKGTGWRVRIETPADPDLAAYLIPKGSITMDGVSLTVAALWEGRGGECGFEVALIPTTLERTTLGKLKRGDLVNLEADLIAKTVVTWLERFTPASAAAPPPPLPGRRR